MPNKGLERAARQRERIRELTEVVEEREHVIEDLKRKLKARSERNATLEEATDAHQKHFEDCDGCL